MAGHLTKLRIESLEDRRVLSAAPLLDLNGAAPGTDFAVERVNGAGLVALVAHDMFVNDDGAPQLASATITIADHQAGDTLGALTHGTNINAAYADGVLHLTGVDSVTNYQQVLRTTRFNSTATRNAGDQVDVSFVVNDGLVVSEAAHSVVTTIPAGTASIAGRQLFYNHSKFDGDNLAADSSDDSAIATDKQALPQGQTATLANYTNYHRGINGIIVDIAGPHGAVAANDFIFQVGNNNLPDTWLDAPEPISITTRTGAGVGGSDRVEIIWTDGAIANNWLQVVVAANSHTGLAKPDTFLFGNSIGESGNSSSDARVTAKDVLLVINRILHGGTDAAIDDRLDFSRDGKFTGLDVLLPINRILSASPNLNLVNVLPIAPERINSTSSTGIIGTRQINYPPMIAVYWLYPMPLINGYRLGFDRLVNVEPTTATLFFPYALSTDGGTAGPHSAANVNNYQLFKGGVEQPGSIVSAVVNTTTSSSTPATTESSVTLSFDHALTPGDYRLVALGTIFDTNSQPIDGRGNSPSGSEYSTSFSVAAEIRHGDATIVSRMADSPSGSIWSPAVASTPSGDFIVAWSKANPAYGEYSLFIQRFSPSHTPLGAPQLVSKDANARDVSLGVDAAGTLTVVWSSQNDIASSYDRFQFVGPGHIYARRFGADLSPLGDQFQIDPPSAVGWSSDYPSGTHPDIAVNSRGDMVVAWIENMSNGTSQLVARLYDATGQARGNMFSLSSGAIDDYWNPPQIAMDATGSFGAVWSVSVRSSTRLVARLFDASGQPRGAEFTIQQSTGEITPSEPAIAMSAAGDFAVAWINTGCWSSETLVRRFDATGQPVAEAFQVDTRSYHWSVGSPQLSLDTDGNVLVAWQVRRTAVQTGYYTPPLAAKSLFYARVYDGAGQALTGSSLVTSDQFVDPRTLDEYTGPYVSNAAIATNNVGQAMIVWTNGPLDYWSNYALYDDTLLTQTWNLNLAGGG
jgi:hypothetical protein